MFIILRRREFLFAILFSRKQQWQGQTGTKRERAQLAKISADFFLKGATVAHLPSASPRIVRACVRFFYYAACRKFGSKYSTVVIVHPRKDKTRTLQTHWCGSATLERR